MAHIILDLLAPFHVVTKPLARRRECGGLLARRKRPYDGSRRSQGMWITL